jgi:hypothetical protein
MLAFCSTLSYQDMYTNFSVNYTKQFQKHTHKIEGNKVQHVSWAIKGSTYSFLDISKNEPDGEFTEDLIISKIIWCQMLLDWILYPYSVTQLDAGKIGYYPSYFA